MDGMSDTLRRHAPGLQARITFSDGTYRSVMLHGFGCSAAICSRVFVKAIASNGATAKIPLDQLLTITDITEGSALFTTKNGTQQRLSLVKDFRVLYAAGETEQQKLDLSKIHSLEMLTSAK
jgi:hypothetical protein